MPLSQYIKPDSRSALLSLFGSDYEGRCRGRANAAVAAGQQEIELQGVATVEKLLIGANFPSHASLQDGDEFHAGVLTKAEFPRGHGAEVRQIRVEFTIGSGKVLGFKAMASRSAAPGKGRRSFLQVIANVCLFFSSEKEMIEAHTEKQRNARKRRQSRVKFAALQLREQHGGKAGMFAPVEQTHFAAQAQLPEFVLHGILIRGFFQRWRDRKAPFCSSPSTVGKNI
jgi:hypothetical protein